MNFTTENYIESYTVYFLSMAQTSIMNNLTFEKHYHETLSQLGPKHLLLNFRYFLAIVNLLYDKLTPHTIDLKSSNINSICIFHHTYLKISGLALVSNSSNRGTHHQV